ncbi:MAG: SIMPL domain-containing protein [candidate division WOR-3 bacterium]
MRFFSALVLGIAFVLGMGVIGRDIIYARLGSPAVRVVGSASRLVESDVVKWRITIGRNTGVADVRSGYAALRRDHDLLIAFLTRSGIPQSEIAIQPVNRGNNYDNEGRITGYSLSQSFDIVSTRIDTVERLALNPDVLYDQGVSLQSSHLEYYLSRLPEIKRELLAEATLDAKARAEEIARNAGRTVGKIADARAGVFQITEPYSTDVSDYGIYSTTTRQKSVRITVSASFTMR